jgi:uroporphyrinogen III methyltransferase/synthase
LITVRGTQCLAAADLVLYDYLVNPLLLDYAPVSAERVCLGQPHVGRTVPQAEIHARMIEAARQGKTVVRLKNGDPHLFGRGAEECAALTAAGIRYEVVPGVTAALAAAGCTGIPITHRDHASAVALVTGHRRGDDPAPALDYGALASFPGTLVFYMAVGTAPHWSQSLLEGGKRPDTPVAIVRRTSWPDQHVTRTTLAHVAQVIEREHIRPPAVIIIGEVAGVT